MIEIVGRSEAVACVSVGVGRVYRGMQSEVGVMAAWQLPGLGFSRCECEDAQGRLAVPTDTPLHPPYTACD